MWIETYLECPIFLTILVTLYTGVWIETLLSRQSWSCPVVTLYTGVWIETLAQAVCQMILMCHTLHGCVDWNNSADKFDGIIDHVTLYTGVWIETQYNHYQLLIGLPHSTRVCGLKPRRGHRHMAQWPGSHPIRVWRLKQKTVLPHSPFGMSHPYGCEDWNESFVNELTVSGHTLFGCGDWNWLIDGFIDKSNGHILTGVGIETYHQGIIKYRIIAWKLKEFIY